MAGAARRWLCVLGAFVIYFQLGGIERGFGVWYVEILHRFECPAALTAWISGLNTGLRLLLSPLVAALCRRWSPRAVSMAGGAVFGLSLFLGAFASEIELVILAQGVGGGVGGALTYLPPFLVMAQHFRRSRSIAFALAFTGAGVGALCYSALFSLLFSSLSYQEAVAVVAGLSLHMVPASALFAPPVPDGERQPLLGPEAPRRPGLSFRLDLLLSPAVLLLTAGGCLAMWASFPFLLLVVDFALERGIPSGSGSIVPAVCGAAEVAYRVLAGLLLHVPSMRALAFPLWTLFAAGMSLTAVAITQCVHLWQFILVAVLNTGFMAAFYTTGPIVVSQYFSDDVFSDVLGLFSLGLGLGSITGTYLSGALRDISQSYVMSYYVMGAEALAAFCVLWLSFALVLRLRKRNCSYLRKGGADGKLGV